MGLHQLSLILSLHFRATDCLGYVASVLVLAAFSVQSMRTLRYVAIASNFAFISYAIGAGLPPILILHGILLPINVLRLIELHRQNPHKADARQRLNSRKHGNRMTHVRASAAGQ